MSHSDSLKNVPTVDSKEFENFLKNNGFYETISPDNAINDAESKTNEDVQQEDTSISMKIFNKVSKWCDKNPEKSMLIFFGGATIIICKISVALLSQAIFKGNVKTAKYFEKHSS